MMTPRFDIAIIGSGFSGSILASILARHGRSVALIDSQQHPRFAIGESSTPIADLLLRRLGERHDDQDLVALSNYGRWKSYHPSIACGCKRGFSYYVHKPNQPFYESDEHEHSLLVAASRHSEVADTHWYRPEVDQFLFSKAVACGATDFSGQRVSALQLGEPLSLTLRNDVLGNECRLRADWVIDASGSSAVTARLCNRPDFARRLRTQTYASFGHFAGVASWREELVRLGVKTDDDPFDPDLAAQHHLIDEGWIWMLRFDNQLTSVGIASPYRKPRLDWSRYPSLRSILDSARLTAPPEGHAVATRRLQRFFDPIVDVRCLMLPTAAITIDPLHSTGIAHALAGVDRIATIVLGEHAAEATAIAAYRQSVIDEAIWLDRLVATAYQSIGDFRRFSAACQLYFLMSIQCEETLNRGDQPSRLWALEDARLCEAVVRMCGKLSSNDATDRVCQLIAEAISPWNTAGLMNPAVANRYAYTATKR